MQKTPLLSLATIAEIITAPFTDDKSREVRALQLAPEPRKTGNALIDFLKYANAHMHVKGFRIPSKRKTKKNATHKYSHSNRNAVQRRAFAMNKQLHASVA